MFSVVSEKFKLSFRGLELNAAASGEELLLTYVAFCVKCARPATVHRWRNWFGVKHFITCWKQEVEDITLNTLEFLANVNNLCTN